MTSENKKELLRFLICGVAAALTDYLFCQLIILLFDKVSPDTSTLVVTIVSTAVGFTFGVAVNYLISTFWVYRNVDESIKTKSPLFIFWFVVLSLIAMLLSIGVMMLCDVVVVNAIHLDSIMDTSILSIIKESGIKFIADAYFWTYFISFCLKTIVGLIFNYFTRKYILYKEKKPVES